MFWSARYGSGCDWGKVRALTYAVERVDFRRPPVAEVALSLMSAPNPWLTLSDYGAFWWNSLRMDYPNTQDQPAAPPMIEQFPAGPAPGVQLVASLMAGRQWFLSEDYTRLVQLQSDRITLNWRKLNTETYPHYETLRVEMERVTRLWHEFLVEDGLEPSPVLQAEVTYVNHIRSEDLMVGDGNPYRSIRVSWPAMMGLPEELQFQQTFVVDGPNSPARAYVSSAPVMFDDGTNGKSLTLVMRGAPAADDLASALEWLDFGHNQIINSFRDMITDDMRQYWGQDGAI